MPHGISAFLHTACTAHTQFGVGATTKQGWTHHSNDFPQELVLATQAPFNLGYQVFGEAQVMERLLQGLRGLLRLTAVARQALLRGAITAALGFGVVFGVSCVC